MSRDYAIVAEHVHKNFRLPHDKVTTVKGIFTGLLRKGFTAKKYEVQHALKDVSFSVKKGEFLGIVGRNGSGKSTLLKLIAGVYQPTKGSIQTRGRIVPFIELGVGFNAELTGRDNVYLNGAILGFSKNEVDKKYAEIVAFAELERFMDQKLKNYSSGMQVRLAFSVATILAKSDILLIDEVLAVGDASFQRKCYEYFNDLKKANKTVVFVTHDMSAVREYCDRAILIENSEIVFEGTAAEAATKYTRLFNGEIEDDTSDSEVNTWGDKQVVLKDFALTKKNPGRQKEITFKTIVRAQGEVDDPIIGFMIKSPSGAPLVGTNTKLERIAIGKLHKKEQVVLEWTVPNIFADGTYSIDVAINHKDGIGVYEWSEGIGRFTVQKDTHVPFSIAPEMRVVRKK